MEYSGDSRVSGKWGSRVERSRAAGDPELRRVGVASFLASAGNKSCEKEEELNGRRCREIIHLGVKGLHK